MKQNYIKRFKVYLSRAKLENRKIDSHEFRIIVSDANS